MLIPCIFQCGFSWKKSRVRVGDVLVQDCGNSSASALELPQSCAKPLICYIILHSIILHVYYTILAMCVHLLRNNNACHSMIFLLVHSSLLWWYIMSSPGERCYNTVLLYIGEQCVMCFYTISWSAARLYLSEGWGDSHLPCCNCFQKS